MDLEDARDSIMRAPDVPALSNVLLALLNLVGAMDDEIARQRQRIEALEGASKLAAHQRQMRQDVGTY